MARRVIRSATYADPEAFVFGQAASPVTTRSGLVIGGGTVYPEVNFTLPPMLITDETLGEVIDNYREIIEGVCQRAE